MTHTIPNSVIGAVSSVLAKHYQSHSKLNVLLMRAGARGEPQEGNMETKCKRCNDGESLNPLAILGFAIQKFMDLSPVNSQIADGQKRILESLARNQLSYHLNGFITLVGASLATKSLADFLKRVILHAEFNHAASQLDGDPHAAITSAGSIIEVLCKTYIETFTFDLTAKQSILLLPCGELCKAIWD